MRLVPLLFLLAAGMLAAGPVQAQALCQEGRVTVAGTTYACSRVDLLAHVPLERMRSGGGNDIWGWTDPLDGREYALAGTRSGTAFVDVTDPTAPRVLGKLPTATTNSTWRDIKVYRDHAFVVSEAPGHGLQVFDLTRLRGLDEDDFRDFAPDLVFHGPPGNTLGSAHNIAINEDTGFAYVVGARAQVGTAPACNTGLYMIDIRDPRAPHFAGCFSEDGYTHDVQCVAYAGPDARYAGREICFASNEDTVTIVDVTDKAAPRMLYRLAYPTPAYTHQGWLTEDQRYFIANDELDEQNIGFPGTRTLFFDVADLENPSFLFAHFNAENTIDHNLYVRGGYAYLSNYESGLRILDVSGLPDPASVREVGFFDTYPQSTTIAFNGQWSNYPYFPSGNVVAQDINNGLFVLRPNLDRPTP
ncbi:MAG: choice-of-anchor B family protein [Rubricoccaceae bacterium]